MFQSETHIEGVLKVDAEVEQSAVGFQDLHSLPIPSALIRHTDLHSRSVLKQMTLGFPTVDHNNKNTPSVYCSTPSTKASANLLPPSFFCTSIPLAVHFWTNFHKHAYLILLLHWIVILFCRVSPPLCLYMRCDCKLSPNVFFCFQHHGEFSLSGVGGSGWALSEGAK